MIAIIDYGAGNLRSVEKALKELGFPSLITGDREEIKSANGIILPGVGSFDSAIMELRQKGLEGIIAEAIALNKPFLGICLGYQLLFESSEEGVEKGLGILKGKVKKFKLDPTLQVPHMGWNRLLIKKKTPLLNGIKDGDLAYFAHSYFPEPSDNAIIMTETDYGRPFASSVVKENLYGIQFHPEKSGEVGLKMLKNFGGLIKHV